MRSALVVVDMLEDFVDGALANPAAKDIVAPIAAVLKRVREDDDWIVVYANDAHHAGDAELRVFPPHAMAGSRGAEVVADIQPRSGDVVVAKRFYSAFTATDLGAILDARQVARVVLVGQHTDCCIRHTGYDAFVRGYEVVVCPDATTVFQPGSDESLETRQERALDYLRTYYGARLEYSDALT